MLGMAMACTSRNERPNSFYPFFILIVCTLACTLNAEMVQLDGLVVLKKKDVGEVIGPIILLAWNEVKKLGLLPNINITWKLHDEDGTKVDLAKFLLDPMDTIDPKDHKVAFVIGATNEDFVEIIGTISRIRNVLYISMTDNPSLYTTGSFPNFASCATGSISLCKIVEILATRYSWTKVAIIVSMEEKFKLRAQTISDEIRSNGKLVSSVIESQMDKSKSYEDILKNRNQLSFTLTRAKDKATFIVLMMDPKQSVYMLRYAREEMDMFNGNFAFLAYGFMDNLDDIDDEEVGDPKIYDGLLTVDKLTYMLDEDAKGKLWNRLKEAFDSSEWKATTAWKRSSKFENKKNTNMKLASLFHDSIMAWATVVNTSIPKDVTDDADVQKIIQNGSLLARNFLNITLFGLSGRIHYSPNLTRYSNWTVSAIKAGTAQRLMTYTGRTGQIEMDDELTFTWPGGKTSPPVEPGDDHRDEDNKKMMIIACSVVGGGLVLCVLSGLIGIRYWKYHTEKQLIWKYRIKWHEIAMSDDSIQESQEAFDHKSSHGSKQTKLFVLAGTYKGSVIAIRKYERGSVNMFEASIYEEFRKILYIQHDNVNRFIGVCCDAPNVCIAMIYAPRGSLQDVLADVSFEINWDFRMSLAVDAAQGMNYLHNSPIQTHGHLTSSNCVIDERWVCKITDYGLQKFRGAEKIHRPLYDLLWTAPEILQRSEDHLDRVYGTQPADIYSFGIILSEILSRELPYKDELGHLNIEEVLAKVKLPVYPPYRPKLPQSDDAVTTEWISLTGSCWQSTIPDRPTFKSVLRVIRGANAGKFTNVMERMQLMLEESIDRAENELRQAKLNTENFLGSILPRSAVRQIAMGKDVPPELLNSVTLCLCDTLGLHKATQALPAEVVVGILQSLYDKYDEVIRNNDLYQVGLWGSKDCMMIAGGLCGNEATAADDICTSALQFMSCIETFETVHFDRRNLEMKISIHTGPVSTVILGKETPQFCIFGETVLLLSHMHQKFSKPMGIRITKKTFDKISKTDKFSTEQSTPIQTNTGQTMVTFWITGKSGFDRPLPQQLQVLARRRSSADTDMMKPKRISSASGTLKPKRRSSANTSKK